jgi:hypothetical protein
VVELEQWYVVQGRVFGYVPRRRSLGLGPRFVICIPLGYDPSTQTLEFVLESQVGYSENVDAMAEAMQEKKAKVRLVTGKIDKWFIVHNKEEKMRAFLRRLPAVAE